MTDSHAAHEPTRKRPRAVAPDRTRLPGGVTVPEIEAGSWLVEWERTEGRPTLYVKSHGLARLGALGVASVLLLGAVWWVNEAQERFDGPRSVAFRGFQYSLALAGIATTVLMIGCLLNFAFRSRMWRHWTGLRTVFGILAGGWMFLWWVDRILTWLD